MLKHVSFLNRKLLLIDIYNPSGLRKLALFHRQLQIIAIHYRLHLSQFQVGCAIPTFIAFQIACLYNTISMISGKDTGAPIWYDLLYAYEEFVAFLLVIFVFGILADVYNVSSETQTKINGKPELKRNKWLKRWIRSCPVFKIHFGGSNYLDRLTPLTVQNFAINQTVSLLLLQN